MEYKHCISHLEAVSLINAQNTKTPSGQLYCFTYTPSFQKQLALAQAVGAVGELNQGFLCLQPCRSVCGLIELLAQVLQLGQALEHRKTQQSETRGVTVQLCSSSTRVIGMYIHIHTYNFTVYTKEGKHTSPCGCWGLKDLLHLILQQITLIWLTEGKKPHPYVSNPYRLHLYSLCRAS